MQVCPEFRNLQKSAPATASSRSASSKTMNGALPPSSSDTFFTCRAHCSMSSLPDGRRAGEAELADDGVRRQLSADLGRAVGVGRDDVEDARREPGPFGQLAEGERRERRLLGRLEHHRAARGQRGGRLAGDHRRREVPGRDPGGDAHRLLEDDDAPVRERRRDRVAVHALRLLAEPLEERGRVADLGTGLGERLSLLEHHQDGEILCVLHHQVGEATQDRRALLGEEAPPRRIGPLGGGDGTASILGSPFAGRRRSAARRRVEDREGLARRRVDPPPVDVGLLAEKRAVREAVDGASRPAPVLAVTPGSVLLRCRRPLRDPEAVQLALHLDEPDEPAEDQPAAEPPEARSFR